MTQDLILYQEQRVDQSILDLIASLDSERSKRIYQHDLATLRDWMIDRGITYHTATESDIVAYRAYLRDRYAKATAQRMYVVCRQLFKKLETSKIRLDDPTSAVHGFKLANESTHIALSKEQARALLAAIDTSTVKGKRDYALISLLLRTGIRRSECAALNIGDLQMEQGHHIAIIQHGKGDKRRKVKIPVDVFRSLETYVAASERAITALDNPLFVGFDRRPEYTGSRIGEKVIERIVYEYGLKIGIARLTPHDMRTSFITLAREGGATLEQRQFAAGHVDSRTTQRYDRRKLNLDNNAVDFIRLDE